MNAEHDRAIARKSRNVGLVIASAGILAILAPWLVVVLGLQIRYEFLFYLISLAGFVWSFVNIYQIWRAGRNNQG
jgi:Family of unknown function (DUF5337)